MLLKAEFYSFVIFFKLCFVLQGGELFEKISPNKGMPEEDGRRYFQQLISAMWFCHASGVAHRDIKPENLILSETGVLKVTDFGLSNLQKINDSGAVSSSLRLKVCTKNTVLGLTTGVPLSLNPI